MKVIIHDLENQQFELLFPHIGKDTLVISDTGRIRNCIGCLGCWIKTPGECVLKDGYEQMGAILSQTEKVVIISRCCYGGYSPFVKNVFDRSIPYLLPFFKTKKNETHHKPRYQSNFRLSVYFYGEQITAREMDTARSLVKANSINFFVPQYEVSFLKTPDELRKAVKVQ